MDAVDEFIPTPDRKADQPFLMPVEDVFTITGRGTVATGRVERGQLKINEEVEIVGLTDEKRKVVVTGIEMFRKLLDYAEAGDNIGALLRGVQRTEIERGQVLAAPGSIHPHTKFHGQVYVLTKDAGVPIKEPVAGISCGLITEGDRWMTMVDIQGLEDFFGDMDFKVAGTHDGITAIQMDLKISGLTPEMIKEALAKTHKARNYILDEVMLKAIPEPRAELSKYAPKMLTTTIPVDKISEVIGKSGKVIKEIQAECEVKIDITEEGNVFISGIDTENCKRALNIVETIAKDPEPGAIYKGKVTRLMDFGAFVEIAPGKEGLCHISQLDVKRTEKVEDVVNVGDVILVKVLEIDDKGRLNLSRREALIEVEGLTPENNVQQSHSRNNRHNGRR